MLSAYLRRLGVSAQPPSVAALFELHRAHVDRVPYETTWIHLGDRWDVDEGAAVERIAFRGRGGYCFHLNGSFAWVLRQLGYSVSLHIGGVHGDTPSVADLSNHLVVLVAGLPTDDNPEGVWYVDVGLGEALYEPLPLVAGEYTQPPMTFGLSAATLGVGDWQFTHDPKGSFAGMIFLRRAAQLSDFAARNKHLSTSPDSGFVRTVTVQRRRPGSVHALRALTYSVRDAAGVTSRVITDREEWFTLLADELCLDLAAVERAARERLWRRACASHADFLERGQQ